MYKKSITNLCNKLLHTMGQDFLDIQYQDSVLGYVVYVVYV